MTYKNPILLCDYSDPDVCRLGEDFFLVASSFNFVPGLPVLHSKDLIHWELISYGCKTIPLPGYDCVQNAKGVWAPSIRYHNGFFYIFFATPDEGIFYTKTDNPFGQWKDLKCVWSGRGFEDPCPLWDDDGRLYLVHAYVKSRIGFNSKLGLMDKIIFDGSKSQPTIEGPKFYKRNGFFYIFAPAGGVTQGWQSVLRSKNIYGPYEEKIVLAQGKSPVNGPHQGGWVDTPSGQDWFIHFQDAGIYGRICHLQPLKWINDWPVMGTSVSLPEDQALSQVGEPLLEWEVPVIKEKNSSGAELPPQWKKTEQSEFQFSANPSNDGKIRGDGSLWLNPKVCTKKIDTKSFTWEKTFNLASRDFDSSLGEKSVRHGIIFLGNEYAALQIQKDSDSFYLSYLESSGSQHGDEVRSESIKFQEKISEKVSQLTLKMNFKAAEDGRQGRVEFSCQTQGQDKNIDFKSQTFTTTNAHWVGGRYGFF